MPEPRTHALVWSGAAEPYIDQVHVASAGRVTLGVFGGSSRAGARKNEDGALVLAHPEGVWEFGAILDGHNSSQSVGAVLSGLGARRAVIAEAMGQPPRRAFADLRHAIVEALASLHPGSIRGETSCLTFARKDRCVWWLNVGDCVLHVLHPDYARLGQYAVNQRSFFEWVGNVTTFAEPVPCFSEGVKRLRTGSNAVLAVTDGVVECGSRPYQDPGVLCDPFLAVDAGSDLVSEVLRSVALQDSRDSATILYWRCPCTAESPLPTG